MKVFKTQKINSTYINMIGFFLILVIFIIMSFLILTMELKFYSRIKDRVDTTFNGTTVVSYINNKIRNYNGRNINIIEDRENDILELIDDEGNYKTYIYIDKGYLCEEMTSINENIDKSRGQKLFPLDKMSIKKEKKLVKLSISIKNSGTKGYFYVN